jgi:hypothetical protein
MVLSANNNTCVATSCEDGIQSGVESDIDCGFSSGCGVCSVLRTSLFRLAAACRHNTLLIHMWDWWILSLLSINRSMKIVSLMVIVLGVLNARVACVN